MFSGLGFDIIMKSKISRNHQRFSIFIILSLIIILDMSSKFSKPSYNDLAVNHTSTQNRKPHYQDLRRGWGWMKKYPLDVTDQKMYVLAKTKQNKRQKS